jgi:hypothetical protein
MKKQIDPSIKAHLLWSALILLSLLAICAIPFALAQSRNRGTDRTDQLQLPANMSGPLAIPASQIPPPPKLPNDIVLYDQLNDPGTSATSSEEQLGSPQFTDFAADDFFVPPGETWVITEVDAQGVNGVMVPDNFNIFFYQPGNGGFPGTQVYAATAQPYVNNSGVFQVTLTAPAVLTTGDYWVSIQAHISGSENPTWRWMDHRTGLNVTAAWQNPGGGFNSCFTWGRRTTCVGDVAAPDQMFRIIGTIGAFGTPTPTPAATGTPSPTPSGTPSPSCTPNSSPTPGACTTYEAESCNNTLTGSAFVLNCPTCSGGQKVGYVGSNSGTLEFDFVGVVAPGNHTVTICYLNGDAVRYALLSVNGSPGTPVSFPSTGSFQTVGSIQTTITLNTGNNTLEFFNPIVGSWAPDFDQIQFNCPTSCPLTHPLFFTGEVALSNGVYYLQFPNGTPFGYYSYLADQRFIYHFDMGFEYWFDANDANHGIFFYDFASSSFFYTSPSTFPFLYDFRLHAWLYYLPDVNNPGRYTHNPRWFFNFATGQWITL